MLKRAVFVSLALFGSSINPVSAEEPSTASEVIAETKVIQDEADKYWTAAHEALATGYDRMVLSHQHECFELIQAEDSRIAAVNAWAKAKALKGKIDLTIERLLMIPEGGPPKENPNRDKIIADCRKQMRPKKK